MRDMSITRSNILGVPNLLTCARILSIPAVALCFLIPEQPARWIALFIFVIAALTDFFDGFVARRYALHSRFGRMLDPIADKLLIAVCLLLLAADGTITGMSLFAAIIILCREILVSGLREFLAELNVGLPVSRLAKWKTVLQSVAIGFLLAGTHGVEIFPPTLEIGHAALWMAAFLTLYTGYDYFRAGISYLIQD